MSIKKICAVLLTFAVVLSLCACAGGEETPVGEKSEVAVTDLMGREVTVHPGSYKRVVCIGAGALRMYSYIGDVSLLAGVEDIDNTSLSERPKMFDSVARPYVMVNSEVFSKLPSYLASSRFESTT
jgi:iron complex transport system substrate-binding protein